MKIYTKSGDNGTTSLIGGKRVLKNDPRVEAYGTIDELNSFIGFLLTQQDFPKVEVEFLQQVQRELFHIGAILATDDEKKSSLKKLSQVEITDLEKQIDIIVKKIPSFNSFVIPGVTEASSMCHICRTVTRRAERRLIDVSLIYSVDNLIQIYLNRLSDYFFVLSRYILIIQGKEEFFLKK